jgi:hypothetical protein
MGKAAPNPPVGGFAVGAVDEYTVFCIPGVIG